MVKIQIWRGMRVVVCEWMGNEQCKKFDRESQYSIYYAMKRMKKIGRKYGTENCWLFDVNQRRKKIKDGGCRHNTPHPERAQAPGIGAGRQRGGDVARRTLDAAQTQPRPVSGKGKWNTARMWTKQTRRKKRTWAISGGNSNLVVWRPRESGSHLPFDQIFLANNRIANTATGRRCPSGPVGAPRQDPERASPPRPMVLAWAANQFSQSGRGANFSGGHI